MRCILVVEDDEIQEDIVVSALRNAFRGVLVKSIKTEHDFRHQFDAIKNDPPDVIVLDVMLRWTNPAPDMPPPDDDVKTQGLNRAGFRCLKLLREDEGTRNIPVILYSVLERVDIMHEFQPSDPDIYLLKDSDTDSLVRKINERLRANLVSS